MCNSSTCVHTQGNIAFNGLNYTDYLDYIRKLGMAQQAEMPNSMIEISSESTYAKKNKLLLLCR
jgi:hypothetical protein